MSRARDRGFFKQANGSFEEIAMEAQRLQGDVVGPRIESLKSELSDLQQKTVPLKFLGLTDAQKQTVVKMTPAKFKKQAKKIFEDQIEDLRLSRLNAAEVKDRVAARETIKSVRGTLKGLKSGRQNKRGFVALHEDKEAAEQLWQEFADAKKFLSEQNKVIDERGFTFDEIYEARQEFFQKARLDKPPGEQTTGSELLTRMAIKLKAAEQKLASKIDPKLAKELQTLQTEFADLVDIEGLAFNADASLVAKQPERYRLTFGIKPAIVGGAQKSVLGRTGELARFRLSEQLRGAIPVEEGAGLISTDTAARGIAGTIDAMGPLVNPIAQVTAVPFKIGGQSMMRAGNITRNVSELMNHEQKFLSLIPSTIVNAHVIETLKNGDASDIDPLFIQEASAEEVAPILDQISFQAEPIASREAVLAKTAFATQDEEVIGQYVSEMSQKFPVFEAGKEFGEVKVGGKRKVYGRAVDIYRDKVMKNSSLDLGQKARMVSAVNDDGTIISAPKKTVVRKESIIPKADKTLDEEQQ